MDKGAKDKLAGSPGENGGGQDAQKDLHSRMEGARRRRRPRKGWREVERDLQVLGVRRWRELVIDRDKWRGIVRQAKARSGLQRQQKKKKKKIPPPSSGLRCFRNVCNHPPHRSMNPHGRQDVNCQIIAAVILDVPERLTFLPSTVAFSDRID